MEQKKLSGLERQDAFVKSIVDNKFDYGLIVTQAFLKGIRDIGYKSTATALFESIDNSIQAEANNIHIIFDWDKGNSAKGAPDRIAIIDDGYGMSPEMLRVAVLWGGSDRLDNREGMGKYGYGLPSSCVSIGQRFTVVSKRQDMNKWHSVTIDVQEIAERNERYIDKATGRIIAPLAEPAQIPAFISKHLKENNITHKQGAIVIIEKIDRLTKKLFSALKRHLSMETGITYRNFFRQVNIFIDGDPIEPIDPLFITEGYRWYDENDLRAEALPSLEVKMNNITVENKKGIIKVRYSTMPYGFFEKKQDLEAILNKVEKQDEVDNEDKRDKTKRLTVRKRNNGIIFLRNGRQIDVVDSRCPWTKFQNNDRYIGIEVDFTPELDKEFSITTTKQQIVVADEMWNKLYDHGVFAAIQECRKRFSRQSMEAKDKAHGNKGNEIIEEIMKESAKSFESRKEIQPSKVKEEAEENLKQKIHKKAKDAEIPEDLAQQLVENEIEKKPYTLDFIDEEEGPFYRAKQIGSQVVIYVNKAHRFYTDLYNGPKSDNFIRGALALLLFALGHSELRVSDEGRKWYKHERLAWSQKLDTSLENLSKRYSNSADDTVREEEMQNTNAEN